MKQENLDPMWIGNGSEEDYIYKENILDHYKHPHNFGNLKNYNHHFKQVNPVCGDEIEIFILTENSKVKDIRFIGKGCAISVAATSMLTDSIKNKSVDEIKKITTDDIMKMIGIKLGVVRMKCGLLGLKTLQKALEGMISHEPAYC